MLLFAASANVGYANDKSTNVFVRAFTKSDATWLHFGKPSYRLENCDATVSLILCRLRNCYERLVAYSEFFRTVFVTTSPERPVGGVLLFLKEFVLGQRSVAKCTVPRL